MTVTEPGWDRWKSSSDRRSMEARPSPYVAKKVLPSAAPAPGDAAGGPGVLSGIDHLRAPTGGQVLGEADQQVGPVTAREHELGETLPGVDAHQVTEDGLVSHRHEGLRHLEAVGVSPRSLPPAEDKGLHKHPSGPSHMLADATGGVALPLGGGRAGRSCYTASLPWFQWRPSR